MFDPFAGSGTALIAGEKTGRRCLALELDPQYVQAAVDSLAGVYRPDGSAVRHQGCLGHEPTTSTTSRRRERI